MGVKEREKKDEAQSKAVRSVPLIIFFTMFPDLLF